MSTVLTESKQPKTIYLSEYDTTIKKRVTDDIHWNLYEILPYQRHFNFINGTRDLGKTYTLISFFVQQYLLKGTQFIYIVRNINEKNEGALGRAIEKVMWEQYPDIDYDAKNDFVSIDGDIMAHCRALSEVIKVKKQSFPRVLWGVMDEYMLEPKFNSMYVKGWEEPDLLLNLYDTVDRDRDKVTFFMLGNNTAFYNPYHLHPAFNIPTPELGKIWTSNNVLFQWAEPSPELVAKQKQSKFKQMVQGTKYDAFANKGIYIGDNASFVADLPNQKYFTFSIKVNDEYFGIWTTRQNKNVYISKQRNPNVEPIVTIEFADINEGELLAKRDNYLIGWIRKKLINGQIRYESMEVKLKVAKMLERIL